MQNQEYRELWNTIKKVDLGYVYRGEINPSDGVSDVDPAEWTPTYYSKTYHYVSNNPYDLNQWIYGSNMGVNQYTGCTPTAASNLIAFLAQKPPSLNPTNNQKDIVYQLRSDMGTTQASNGDGVTDPADITSGINKYLQAHGVSNLGAGSEYLSGINSIATRFSNYDRPMLQSFWNQSFFGNHTVTLVGYKQYTFDGQVQSTYTVVRNNWDDTTFNLWVKWGTWNTNMISYVVGQQY